MTSCQWCLRPVLSTISLLSPCATSVHTGPQLQPQLVLYRSLDPRTALTPLPLLPALQPLVVMTSIAVPQGGTEKRKLLNQ
jgi:hypothetical protein